MILTPSRHSKRSKKAVKESLVEISAVDLFCGAGGLTHGLLQAGIKVVGGIDIDADCKFPYEANNRAEFIHRSVTDIKGPELSDMFSSDGFTLLAGCAPCQTFSTYNQKATDDDSRWWLLLQFSRLVRETRPDFVTMENVPGLQEQEVFGKFVASLRRIGYKVTHQIVDCSAYGIPQHRHRLVLMASRHGIVELLSPEELECRRVTVKEAIGHLPTLEAGEADPVDPLHTTSALSPLNLKRIQHSRPGGTWKDWPKNLVAACHKRPTGKTYPGVYGRMEWDKSSPTMTTQFFGFGNGRFGHPDIGQNRAISLREGAILQSFPPDYQFVSPGQPVYMKGLGRMIGNAVPVRLGWVIGRTFAEHVNSLAARPA